MIFLQRDYDELKEIILGLRKRSPLAQEFAEWMKKNLSITLLDVRLLSRTDRQLHSELSIIIEKNADELYRHKEKILLEFQKFASAHAFAGRENLRDSLVEFVDFYGESKGYISRESAIEARKLFAERFPMIWQIEVEFSSIMVFYFTEKDIVLYETNGTSNTIANEYYLIITKHDELNYFSQEDMRVAFDSKENIDKNYGGSLFYYSRR